MKNGFSNDSQVILLLCLNLGITKKNLNIPKSLTLSEWNKLTLKLQNSEMQRPSSFLETTPKYWKKQLNLTDGQVERIQQLLARGGQIGIELERLNSLGIWILTRAEETYPKRLKQLLKFKSPVILFGAGDKKLLNADGVAIVGSRDVDEKGTHFAEILAKKCTKEGLTVISGGARGVDSIAQESAISEGGKVISILSHGMEANIKKRYYREGILSGNILILSAELPRSRFKVYSAMNRNKYIYALSKFAVVISSSLEKGGTWTGAMEDLKERWVPLFVRAGNQVPSGNNRLIELGGIALDTEVLLNREIQLHQWFANQEWQKKEKDVKNISFKKMNQKKDHDVEQIKLSIGEPPTSAKVLISSNEINLSEDCDLYPIVWPHIEKILSKPFRETELKEILNISLSQLQFWLKRAIDENKVEKLSRPVRYVASNYANIEKKI
ncbi:MAG: DNA-protecting protein DprA [Halanaerobiales bacterium]|nr:DNA-protecting protein DprA [Halanaerobiales bacterium]